MYRLSMLLIVSVILLSLCACTTPIGRVVVAPQQKIVIPKALLSPPKMLESFQTNLQDFSSQNPTELTK